MPNEKKLRAIGNMFSAIGQLFDWKASESEI